MSQDVNGLIMWLRSWFDNIYALKGDSEIIINHNNGYLEINGVSIIHSNGYLIIN